MQKLILAAVAFGVLWGFADRAQAADDLPKAIIEKAIKAYGGEEKLAKMKAVQVKGRGTLEILGMTVDFTTEGTSQDPGQIKSELTFEIQNQKITIVQVLNKDKGWMKAMGNTMALEGDLLTEMKEEAHSSVVQSLVPLLKDKAFTLAPLGELKVNDQMTLGVKVTCKGHKDIDLYFNKTTGLLAKIARQSIDPQQMKEVARESYPSDYKEMDGLKYPSKMLMNQDGKKLLDLEVTELKFLDKVDDSTFAKP